MSTKFEQLYSSMVFFKEGMKKKWGLNEYHNPNKPAVFMGLYETKDFETFLNHKGPKILIWGGGDMHPYKLQNVANLQKQQEIYTWAYPGEFSDTLSKYNIKHKKLYIALKDYSTFLPTILGENIYVYRGVHGNRPDYFKWEEVVSPLIKVFGEDRIKFTNHLPMDELIEKVYKDCFVYIKPNPKGGCTSMFELAHMGVRTIGKNHKNLDCFTEYSDIPNLLDLIMEESKFIGKTRKDIANSTKEIFTGPEWLDLNFWI